MHPKTNLTDVVSTTRFSNNTLYYNDVLRLDSRKQGSQILAHKQTENSLEQPWTSQLIFKLAQRGFNLAILKISLGNYTGISKSSTHKTVSTHSSP